MLTINDVPAPCIIQASQQYYVPVPLIIAVLKTEGGHKGLAKHNHNGTVDYGPMQINSIWLKKLKKYGYTAHKLEYNACANVKAGTWILARKIASDSKLWHGVGDYHSRTSKYNQRYRHKVNHYYRWIHRALHLNSSSVPGEHARDAEERE